MKTERLGETEHPASDHPFWNDWHATIKVEGWIPGASFHSDEGTPEFLFYKFLALAGDRGLVVDNLSLSAFTCEIYEEDIPCSEILFAFHRETGANLVFTDVNGHVGAISLEQARKIWQEQEPAQSTHTPGPWHEGQGNGEGSIFMTGEGRMRMTDHGTSLYPICRMTRGWEEGEDAANARLVAAAPDVFAALVELQANPNDPKAHGKALAAFRLVKEGLR